MHQMHNEDIAQSFMQEFLLFTKQFLQIRYSSHSVTEFTMKGDKIFALFT